MACTNPRKAWVYGRHESGKQKLVFRNPGIDTEPMDIPCGKCASCRLDYSRDWATRAYHEMQTSKVGAFLTLTIDDYHMQREGFYVGDDYHPPFSLYKRSLQKFMKRLREYTAIPGPDGSPIYQRYKYLACGEYGSKYSRPHYHVLLMGYDFPDKKAHTVTARRDTLYRSETLEKAWKFGYSTLGEANWSTAAYIARYTLKKRTGPDAYWYTDMETGEAHKVKPEFLLMSKGIGKDWWHKYKGDTDKDYVTVNGKTTTRIPRYYDKLRERENPESLEEIKAARARYALDNQTDATKERNLSRNTVKERQISQLRRGYEDG